MRLSSLKNGEHGYVAKIYGDNTLKRRLIELGFINGQRIDVLLNAPLKDPIKYKIMDFEVSLRREEADLIEISLDNNCALVPKCNKCSFCIHSCHINKSDQLHIDNNKKISAALIGNPNCGKTSLFNYLSGSSEKVGNYAGVTVEAKESTICYNGYSIQLTDLPGTYSLSSYSPEESYVKNYIVKNRPDIIVNVIDSTTLQRGLYLTIQLFEMDIPIICALSMYDKFKNNGYVLDFVKLSELLSIRMVAITTNNGDGAYTLLDNIIDEYRNVCTGNATSHCINYEHHIEQAISNVSNELSHIGFNKYPKRYTSIQLLCDDTEMKKLVDNDKINKIVSDTVEKTKNDTNQDCNTIITNKRYGFINGALKESGYDKRETFDKYKISDIIDRFVINKWVSFPLLTLILTITFKTVFNLGQHLSNFMMIGIEKLLQLSLGFFHDGIIKDIIVDGIIPGVGSVMVFLPQMVILYTFLSLMEESGYMARTVFIMDKLMHKVGLHGKSFIPLIMGLGCNVPAIVSTRIIENKTNRIITILISPFISCSARLPVYITLVGLFFEPKYQLSIIIGLYILGIAIALLTCKILSKILNNDKSLFVMELPAYKIPDIKQTLKQAWFNTKQYLNKMWTIILFASIIIWGLGYFPRSSELAKSEQIEQSYICKIGKTIEPIFKPLGFTWQLNVALLAGIGAKETIVSTISMLYSENNVLKRDKIINDGINKRIIMAFLVFVLLYFPCLATIVAIKNELGFKIAFAEVLYTTGIAWIMSFIITKIPI